LLWPFVQLSCASADDEVVDNPPIGASTTLGKTRGPNSEIATTSALRLTASEVVEVPAGMGHTAAVLWHQDAEFTTAVTAGVRDEFERLDVEVIAETSANCDVAKQ
jgi:ribose transport system substrate-binding protein